MERLGSFNRAVKSPCVFTATTTVTNRGHVQFLMKKKKMKEKERKKEERKKEEKKGGGGGVASCLSMVGVGVGGEF